MDEERPLFILAGNGPYANRGCEAIVRGTTKILREHFRDPRFVCLSHFQSEEQYRVQKYQETDNAISHLTSQRLYKDQVIQNFWKPDLWLKLFQRFFRHDTYLSQIYRDMIPYLDKASAVLSVGGDHYSLDYGRPTLYTTLDNLVLARDKNQVLWGASVGPFNSIPDYERYMSKHLQKVTAIFARESVSVKYLQHIGVSENVYPVADPAFLMDPIKPEGIDEDLPIDEESIGINLSPLMAKYVTNNNLEEWISMAASIITDVAQNTEMPIYLIPHVINPTSNDFEFLQRVLSLIKTKENNITLVPPKYNAAETKWIIGQMKLFAGARTHSTIAALSSCVPTLSFAYSIKAQGINKDVYEHTDYCLNPGDLDSKTISNQISIMLDQNTEIRTRLREKIPRVQRTALNSGSELKRIIKER